MATRSCWRASAFSASSWCLASAFASSDAGTLAPLATSRAPLSSAAVTLGSFSSTSTFLRARCWAFDSSVTTSTVTSPFGSSGSTARASAMPRPTPLIRFLIFFFSSLSFSPTFFFVVFFFGFSSPSAAGAPSSAVFFFFITFFFNSLEPSSLGALSASAPCGAAASSSSATALSSTASSSFSSSGRPDWAPLALSKLKSSACPKLFA
mmetsp:Transcript_102116/g.289149  ORF Transcript_102116/g.289149 Transcript_102116/m.289149 type:complete len:208 (+) Transcript_102116:994-1617(+)